MEKAAAPSPSSQGKSICVAHLFNVGPKTLPSSHSRDIYSVEHLSNDPNAATEMMTTVFTVYMPFRKIPLTTMLIMAATRCVPVSFFYHNNFGAG